MIWLGEINVAEAQQLLVNAKRDGKKVAIMANVSETQAILEIRQVENYDERVPALKAERLN